MKQIKTFTFTVSSFDFEFSVLNMNKSENHDFQKKGVRQGVSTEQVSHGSNVLHSLQFKSHIQYNIIQAGSLFNVDEIPMTNMACKIMSIYAFSHVYSSDCPSVYEIAITSTCRFERAKL